MPRKARKNIIRPGALYHIVCRGNNQRNIFREERDYRKFLRILKEVKEEIPFYFYCFELLPNHYHMEIELKDALLSKIMHKINFLYARYFHYRYKTSGHLFQGRFFSNLIDKERYLWEVARYIDFNAVRAGLVKKTEDYLWGSYHVYKQTPQSKFYEKLNLIDKERFLKYIGKDLEAARKVYLKFVQEGLNLKKKPSFPIKKSMI